MADLGHRVMSPALRTEPVRAREKIRLEDRLQHQLQGRLDHPIPHSRRYPTGEACRSRLRDHPLPYRQRAEAAVLQLDRSSSRNTSTPCPTSTWWAVWPSTPAVRAPLLPRTRSQATSRNAGIGDEVVQIIEPAMRIAGCPTVQLGLDLPYPSLSPIQLTLRFVGVHRRPPGIPASLLLTCWPPSPCTRPLPRSDYYGASVPSQALGRQRTCPPPAWMAGRRGRPGTVPTFTMQSIDE